MTTYKHKKIQKVKKPFDEFLSEVQKGLKGLNKGLPMGLPKLESYIGGIQRKRYDLIFAESGVGKSSFVWGTYIMFPYDWKVKNPDKNIKLKIKLFSLEVSKEQVIAKLVCLKLFLEYKIIVDSRYIFSKDENMKLSDEIRSLIYNLREYFDVMFDDCVEIIDRPTNPSSAKKLIDDFAKERGRTEVDSSGNEHYVPNDPYEYVIIIFDTVGNLVPEQYEGKISRKGTIDLHSSYCRDYYRNLYGYTVVNVSHMNRSNNDSIRLRSGDIFPKVSDIKETGMLDQDANLILALFDPMKHLSSNPMMATFMGYEVAKSIRNKFRAIGILKNREGENNKRMGLIYIGENGFFRELPTAVEMSQEYYNKIEALQHYRYLSIEEKDRTFTKILEEHKDVNITTNKDTSGESRSEETVDNR